MTATIDSESKTNAKRPRQIIQPVPVEQKVEDKGPDYVPNKTDQMYMEERRLVKGIFKCFEPIGGSATFTCKKYKQDKPLTITMVDGEQYEIPLWLARHLNNNCWYPTHSHVVDAQGKPTVAVGKKNHRYGFQSLDFI